MVEINKVYTKTGDAGTTGLLGKERLCKSAPRIEALGAIDELNCHFGMVHANLEAQQALSDAINRIQNDLFNMGAEIALQQNNIPKSLNIISPQKITELEQEIDNMNAALPPLKSFILPQGNKTIAQLHITRSVCRRAERRVVELHQTESLSAEILQYLNRLSDWLFVVARYVSHQTQHTETLWHSQAGEENAEK
jgi:cob(I)alamin adenosyltransferase